MTQRILETARDRAMFIRFLENHELPATVTITQGGKRTVKQNRLNRLWMKEISEELGWESEYARAYCKLLMGVPILRAENEKFDEAYGKIIEGLSWQDKIALMSEPFDFAVTRLMTTKQQKNYMDAVHRHFSEKGVMLTNPDDLSSIGDAPARASSEPAAKPRAAGSNPYERATRGQP